MLRQSQPPRPKSQRHRLKLRRKKHQRKRPLKRRTSQPRTPNQQMTQRLPARPPSQRKKRLKELKNQLKTPRKSLKHQRRNLLRRPKNKLQLMLLRSQPTMRLRSLPLLTPTSRPLPMLQLVTISPRMPENSRLQLQSWLNSAPDALRSSNLFIYYNASTI